MAGWRRDEVRAQARSAREVDATPVPTPGRRVRVAAGAPTSAGIASQLLRSASGAMARARACKADPRLALDLRAAVMRVDEALEQLAGLPDRAFTAEMRAARDQIERERDELAPPLTVADAGAARIADWQRHADPIARRLGLGAVDLDAGDQARSVTDAKASRGVALGGRVHLHPDLEPDTAEGREVLAHELVHLAQARLAGGDGTSGGRDAAEDEAAALAPLLAAGIAAPAPRQPIDLSSPAADKDAKKQTAREYFNDHKSSIQMRAVDVVEKAPFATYTEGVQWTSTGAAQFAAALHSEIIKRDDLETLVRPEPITALLDSARLLDTSAHAPGAIGARGPATFVVGAGIAVGNALVRRAAESLQRVIPRYAQLARGGATPSVDDIVIRHPMDRAVVLALRRGNHLAIDSATFNPANVPKPRAKRDIKLTKVGTTGMWWRLESPLDATIDEVARQLFDDRYNEEAFRIHDAHPLYGVDADSLRKDAPGPDAATALLGAGDAVVDEAALAEVGAAPGKARSREEILEQMRLNAFLLRNGIRAAAQRFGLGARLEPAAKRIDDRVKRLTKAGDKEIAKWDAHAAMQARVLYVASEGLAADGMRLEAYAPQFEVDLAADPGAFKLPAEHRAVLRADAELWTEALEVSDLKVAAGRHLRAAAQHSSTLELEILERGLGAARDAAVAVAGAKGAKADLSAGTLPAREKELRMQLAQTRAQLLADPSKVNPTATAKTTADARDLIFESNLIGNLAAIEEAWTALDDELGAMARIAGDKGAIDRLKHDGTRYGTATREVFALYKAGKRTEARTKWEALCADTEFQAYLGRVQKLLVRIGKHKRIIRLIAFVAITIASMGAGLVIEGVVGGALAAAGVAGARIGGQIAGFLGMAATFTVLENAAFAKHHGAGALLTSFGKNLLLFGLMELTMGAVRASGAAKLFEVGATDLKAAALAKASANQVAELVLTGGVGVAFAVVTAKVEAAMARAPMTSQQVTELIEDTVAQVIIFTLVGRIAKSPMQALKVRASAVGAKWTLALEGYVAQRDYVKRLEAKGKPPLDEVAVAAGRDREQARLELEALEQLKQVATKDPAVLAGSGVANPAALDAHIETARVHEQRAYGMEMGAAFKQVGTNTFLVPREKVKAVLEANQAKKPRVVHVDLESGAKTREIPGEPTIWIVEEIPAWARTPAGKAMVEAAKALGVRDALLDVAASKGEHVLRAYEARARRDAGAMRSALEAAEVRATVKAAFVQEVAAAQVRDLIETDPIMRQSIAKLEQSFSRANIEQLLAKAPSGEAASFLHLIVEPTMTAKQIQGAGLTFYAELAANPHALRFARRYGVKLYKRLLDLQPSPDAVRATLDIVDARCKDDIAGTKGFRDQLEAAKDYPAVTKLLDPTAPVAKRPRVKRVPVSKTRLQIDRNDAWETQRAQTQREAEAHKETLTDDQIDLRTDCDVFFARAKQLWYRQFQHRQRVDFLDAFDHVAKQSKAPDWWINSHRGTVSEALFNPEFGMQKTAFKGNKEVKVGRKPDGTYESDYVVPDYKIEHPGFKEWINQKSDRIDQGTKNAKGVFESGVDAAKTYLRNARDGRAKPKKPGERLPPEAGALPVGDRYSLEFVRDPGALTKEAMLEILFSDGTIFRVKFGDKPWEPNPKYKVTTP
jgi:hypothetical protein